MDWCEGVGWRIFPRVLIRCYYRKGFRHHFFFFFFNITEAGSSRIFIRIVPADYYQWKRKHQEMSFYMSSNSFASFLSQMSKLVHSSLHYSSWSSRFTSRDLCLLCGSLARFWSSEDKLMVVPGEHVSLSLSVCLPPPPPRLWLSGSVSVKAWLV